MCQDLLDLKKFIETDILEKPILLFKELNRGGSSKNFLIQGKNFAYVVKVLSSMQEQRVERLAKILQALNMPDFNSPHLVYFKNKSFHKFHNQLLLFMEYIKGEKLPRNKLPTPVLEQIIQNYIRFEQIDFASADFLRPAHVAQEIYLQNKQKLVTLQLSKINLLEKYFLKQIYQINENIARHFAQPDCQKGIIHGDASLNNMLTDKFGKIFFLDFECIGYGFPTEDFAQLVMLCFLQQSIFNFNKKAMQKAIQEICKQQHYSRADFLYGVNMYFLNFIHRRISSGKIFKSLRKDWLFVKHAQKYTQILQLLQTI